MTLTLTVNYEEALAPSLVYTSPAPLWLTAFFLSPMCAGGRGGEEGDGEEGKSEGGVGMVTYQAALPPFCSSPSPTVSDSHQGTASAPATVSALRARRPPTFSSPGATGAARARAFFLHARGTVCARGKRVRSHQGPEARGSGGFTAAIITSARRRGTIFGPPFPPSLPRRV